MRRRIHTGSLFRHTHLLAITHSDGLLRLRDFTIVVEQERERHLAQRDIITGRTSYCMCVERQESVALLKDALYTDYLLHISFKGHLECLALALVVAASAFSICRR